MAGMSIDNVDTKKAIKSRYKLFGYEDWYT